MLHADLLDLAIVDLSDEFTQGDFRRLFLGRLIENHDADDDEEDEHDGREMAEELFHRFDLWRSSDFISFSIISCSTREKESALREISKLIKSELLKRI